MARILCIDYGLKRCGVAVTDPLQIAVHGLVTVDKKDLFEYIVDYCREEDVSKLVLGHPELDTGRRTPVVQSLEDFAEKIKRALPAMEIDLHDESYTSQDAADIILSSGIGRKKRRDKALVDKVSAVIILQDYLGHI
ncbi:MAG: Holliday junction resolvase RuvX [Saprospiraceae bacterium]|nr:Holliday junction resolvase RuvX [Saprospiraceae bacterium]